MTTISSSRLFRLGRYRSVACALSILPLAAGCGSAGDGPPSASESQQLQAAPSAPAAPDIETTSNGDTTVRLTSNGHLFTFAVPSKGPITIGEGAPIGSAQVLNADLVAAKTPAQLYQLVAGSGATVPDAIVNAQNQGDAQTVAAGASAALAPGSRQSARGGGPALYDSGEQSSFKSSYCLSGWECIQGWDWADSSAGYVSGRGYQTYALNGDEASCSRTFNEDYWNGSTWANLASFSVQPGWTYSAYGGNTGAPTMTDGNWYFESELLDCGGTSTQVSLADITFPYLPPSLTFKMSGSAPVEYCPPAEYGEGCSGYGGDAYIASGNINVSLNGNWSTTTGQVVVTDSGSVGTDSFHTPISCSIPGLTLNWYCDPGQNLVQNPTCTLNAGSGTDASLTSDWSSVYAAYQSSSTVNCSISCTLE
jgi:hypothetical protein